MGATASGGVVAVDLYDGSSVINDDTGTANAMAINASSIGTTWAPQSGVFRLPRVVPASVFLRLRLSTAITNTKNLYVDQASLVKMTPAYADGPYMALFAGNTDFTPGDSYQVTVSNDYGGKFQMWFDRSMLLREKGLLLPSKTSGNSISDSLIA